ncbi:MAG: hypothetical protein H6644_10415 [Caldilineaceae bacterium]|nr:hypothetical protein [Caldilineaceae bacterium]
MDPVGDARGAEPGTAAGILPLPWGKFATPTDVTSGTFMGTPALGKALLAATDAGADPFDLLFFDQCFAGNLDILYEVRRAADVFIAPPNYAGSLRALPALSGRVCADAQRARDGECRHQRLPALAQRRPSQRHLLAHPGRHRGRGRGAG